MQDKCHLAPAANRFPARKDTVAVIHSLSRLENTNTTFPQTQTIMDGTSASSVSTADPYP